MKLLILAALAAVAVARPQYGYEAPAPAPSNTYAAPRSADSDESVEQIPILRHDLDQEEDGTYNLDVETGNGIVLAQSGDSDGDKQGVISFTHPDGTEFHMTYVADENGFQPQSDALPVAPAFPHPIPEFVLEQIRFAAENPLPEDSSEEVSAPRSNYAAPRGKRDAPARGYGAPAQRAASAESAEFIPILRHDLEQEDDGTYSLDVETGNGIVLAQSGDSDGDKQGVISFTHPDGSEFHLTYVADENGFQPQSDALPVAPAFPHPIPEFVLEQIRFAAENPLPEESSEEVRAPRTGYGAPN